MSPAWLQFVLYLLFLLLLSVPMGGFMGRVLEGERTFLHPVLGPLEGGLLRLMGVHDENMGWRSYALAILLFNLIGGLALYTLLKAQALLPLNPDHMGPVATDLAINTAVSFTTNTNWQAYSGETTLSYLAQMAGLAVQNFLSAATGLAVLAALIRGFARRESESLGNAWVDLVRSTVYILLPLSLVFALVMVSQGVVQTLSGAIRIASGQLIAVGPVASQVAIKMLGTNGGGFFNANAAHPFENPTPLSNFLQTLAILLIPAGLCHTFGRLVKDRRQGWALLAAMTLLFLGALAMVSTLEARPNPQLTRVGVLQPAGNMEGKEVRFGVAGTSLFATATTAASCGAVNGMHDSLSPLGGLLPLWLMQLGEVVFGGVGSGLYGMLLFAMVGVFISGLMVGRTPEYLGKKLEAFEMKMVSIAILLPPAIVLVGTAAGVLLPSALSSISNPGPHGFTQVLYAFSSAANNNGSAFAGLNANTPFYNFTLALAMLIGRYGTILPVLALAGSLGRKKITPKGPGTLPTHTPLFVATLVGVVLLVGALTFLPALALGPLAEQLSLR